MKYYVDFNLSNLWKKDVSTFFHKAISDNLLPRSNQYSGTAFVDTTNIFDFLIFLNLAVFPVHWFLICHLSYIESNVFGLALLWHKGPKFAIGKLTSSFF